MKTRKRLCYAATLLALISLASCGQNDSDDTLLPAGKYPMTFTTSVNGLAATRATTDNSWDGGERVALQVDGEVKEYRISGTGASATLTSSDPFYWTSTNETKTVKAWYYGNGYSAELNSWKVASDQSPTDNSGYKASDFLYAPAQDISFGSEDKSLNFYHQTARVVINILNEEAATEASQIKSVAFGEDNNLALSGKYTAPDGKANFGTWDTANGAAMGTITPKEIDTPADGSYLKSYTALLIPQNMQGKKFIAITLADGLTYYYVPEGVDDAKFEAGKEYTYDVTVQYGHLDAVLVSVDGVWGGGDTEEVNGVYLLPEFAPDKLKIGDYYYSDGSTSDGGYRKYSDGTIKVLEDVKPVLTTADGKRTVIGIVYSTDISRIGKAATDYLKSIGVTAPRGLVMALTNASEDCRWGDTNKDENGNSGTGTFQNNTSTLEKQYNNVDGYGETQWILKTYGGTTLQYKYTAFYHASRYGTAEEGTSQYAAPANTTGWFIPSMGQWWDILSYLGGIDLNSYRTDQGDYISISGATLTAIDNMNKYLGKIEGATSFSTVKNFFWSSSEFSSNGACGVYFNINGSLYLDKLNKSYDSFKVRCVFAF